ncbi:hypothetical protein GIB67_033824 [Kingdonia uniflora]|uniref:SWIM-type domain-containing protein n=1 Tax=Kingdonia uniflora TaxID=39325 RepID=A0A7J7LID0_9MAGN|nr:hypothetical protein GIB67_033824 [Kingdonia uniflora]
MTSESEEDECFVESYKANEEQFVQSDFTAALTNDKNRDDLIKRCHDIRKSIGTVIVTKRADNSDLGRTPRITFACERSGKFRLNKKDLEKNENPQSSLHRHPVVNYLEGHFYASRLTPNEKKSIAEMSISGVKASGILHALKERDINNASTIIAIYNVRTKIRISEMEGRTQMQHVMKQLAENGYVEFHTRNEATDEACGCTIPQTQGLPCAHEIVQYKPESCSIPLSSIDSHWKKLSCEPTTSINGDVDYMGEISMLIKRFKNSNSELKFDMLKKLKEISNPTTTTLVEPQVKSSIRSRPKNSLAKNQAKAEASTTRNPPSFKFVLEMQESHVKPTMKLRQYIRHVQDVDDNGNCGFRVIACWLGRHENDRVSVRADLINELESYKDDYVLLFGSNEVKTMLKSLSWFTDGWANKPF